MPLCCMYWLVLFVYCISPLMMTVAVNENKQYLFGVRTWFSATPLGWWWEPVVGEVNIMTVSDKKTIHGSNCKSMAHMGLCFAFDFVVVFFLLLRVVLFWGGVINAVCHRRVLGGELCYTECTGTVTIDSLCIPIRMCEIFDWSFALVLFTA